MRSVISLIQLPVQQLTRSRYLDGISLLSKQSAQGGIAYEAIDAHGGVAIGPGGDRIRGERVQ
jgi:hypothetical protein